MSETMPIEYLNDVEPANDNDNDVEEQEVDNLVEIAVEVTKRLEAIEKLESELTATQLREVQTKFSDRISASSVIGAVIPLLLVKLYMDNPEIPMHIAFGAVVAMAAMFAMSKADPEIKSEARRSKIRELELRIEQLQSSSK